MKQQSFKKFFTHHPNKPAVQPDLESDSSKPDRRKSTKFKIKLHKDQKDVDSSKNINHELKIAELESIIKKKDLEIEALKNEMEKLRIQSRGSSYSENIQILHQSESHDNQQPKIEKFYKDDQTFKTIYDELKDNMYLKNLDKDQLTEIVSAMFSKTFSQDEVILKEGDLVDYMFVVGEGELELSKDDQKIGILGPGKAFGEHSFVYRTVRTTGVKALSDGKLWVLSKQTFENILMKFMISRQKTFLDLLNKVPLFNQIPDYNLCKLIDILQEVRYQPNQMVYQQGNRGETLFIIKQGSVEFHRKISENQRKNAVRKVLNQNSFFGEKSLYGEEWYDSDAIAGPKGCVLLQIQREAFSNFIGTISRIRGEFTDDQKQSSQLKTFAESPPEIPENQNSQNSLHQGGNMFSKTALTQQEYFQKLTIDDLHIVRTIGIGKFSRVELVVSKNDTRISFALKQMKKFSIISLGLVPYVLNEKNLLMQISNNFIIRLMKTFHDRKYVYMLMEACIGGDLGRLIKTKHCLTNEQAKFYLACVIEALTYLHKRSIVFRTLEPSHILIDHNGYCKLSNLIYAKELKNGKKTLTFCGTPEYVAPEVILIKGYDFGADYWGLGILLFEMLVGRPPFHGENPLKTYNIIMKGFASENVIPPSVDKNANILIKKFCRQNPAERIGHKQTLHEIEKQKWFDGFKWSNLRNLMYDAPFKPNDTDTTEIDDEDDEFQRDTEIPPDELSNWDRDY